MRRTNPHHDTPNSPIAADWLPVLAAVMVMIAGFLGSFLLLRLDTFRPGVGDIVSFPPGAADEAVLRTPVPATIIGRDGKALGTCTIDPNVIAAAGGSLIVEARRDLTGAAYQVHWTGARTDNPGADCGHDADLLLSRTDLQRLANAAGGFGVGHKSAFR